MPHDSTAGDSGQGPRSLLKAIGQRFFYAETWTWLFVALGVYFRLAEYADNRALYMDEASLFRNLVGRHVFDFTTPLSEFQLAPPGFLAVERAMVRLPYPVWAGRLIPLLCGVASMFLMRSVAHRYVSPRAVPIAVGLFALDDWLIYYTSELKQYSSDILLTLVALLLVPGPTEMTRRRRIALVTFGVVGVWFSHPLALVLGAVGIDLAARAAQRRDWKTVRDDVAMSVFWAISFACCYFVSHRILAKEQFIWVWWHFAFLPFPPRSVDDLVRSFWQILNIFNNPAWIVTPLGVLGSAFLALAFYVVGALSLGRRWRGGLCLLLGAALITLLASTLHQYPFHGRLLLFLVPTVHLLVGEGAATVARPGGAALSFALAALLLIQPAGQDIWNRFVVRRFHGAHDSHGDLAPDLLDYLEKPKLDNPSAPLPPRGGF